MYEWKQLLLSCKRLFQLIQNCVWLLNFAKKNYEPSSLEFKHKFKLLEFNRVMLDANKQRSYDFRACCEWTSSKSEMSSAKTYAMSSIYLKEWIKSNTNYSIENEARSLGEQWRKNTIKPTFYAKRRTLEINTIDRPQWSGENMRYNEIGCIDMERSSERRTFTTKRNHQRY